MASTPDLECGFSRSLFLNWANDSRNTIILTNRTTPETLGRKLIDENQSLERIVLEVKKRVPLEGEELEEYYRKQKEKQLEETIKKLVIFLFCLNCRFLTGHLQGRGIS